MTVLFAVLFMSLIVLMLGGFAYMSWRTLSEARNALDVVMGTFLGLITVVAAIGLGFIWLVPR